MEILFIAYDNESHISYFPIGIGYLASVLRAKGHTVTIYNQDVYHYPEDHLVNFLERNHFDLVGIGVVGGYYQYRKLLKISQAIKRVRRRPFFVIGGHGPSAEPEFFLRRTQADAVVVGEGEIILANLVDAIENKTSLAAVRGVAYWEGEGVKINAREEVIKDIDSIPMPAWDLFPMDHYTLMRYPGIKAWERSFQVCGSRGCPFSCTFCYRMDPGYRRRSTESIIEELRRLKEAYHVTVFDFNDELFMYGENRTISFCEDLLRENLNIRFACQGRLNYASSKVLKLMKKAGCFFIGYGVESLEQDALKRMNKSLTVRQIITGVENTINEGIQPGLYVMWGNIGENAESLHKTVDFLIKYSTGAQLRTIRPVTPYPGSSLYYYAVEKGLLEGPADFYENKHLNSDLLAVNFTDLSDAEFHRLLFEANKRLVEDFYEKQKRYQIDVMHKLYFEKNSTFRGFRQT